MKPLLIFVLILAPLVSNANAWVPLAKTSEATCFVPSECEKLEEQLKRLSNDQIEFRVRKSHGYCGTGQSCTILNTEVFGKRNW